MSKQSSLTFCRRSCCSRLLTSLALRMADSACTRLAAFFSAGSRNLTARFWSRVGFLRGACCLGLLLNGSSACRCGVSAPGRAPWCLCLSLRLSDLGCRCSSFADLPCAGLHLPVKSAKAGQASPKHRAARGHSEPSKQDTSSDCEKANGVEAEQHPAGVYGTTGCAYCCNRGA